MSPILLFFIEEAYYKTHFLKMVQSA